MSYFSNVVKINGERLVGAVGIEISSPLAKSLNQFTRELRFGATWGQKLRHLLYCSYVANRR